MNRADILRLSSMPAASPSYPLPPFRFGGRHFIADLTLPAGQVLLDYMK